MTTKTRFLPALATLLLLAACATLGPTMLGPSTLMPWRHDQLKFPHARHAAAQVDCITCHETAFDAKDLNERLLPPESKCLECHGEEKDKGNCGMCHVDAKVAANWPKREPALFFNHVNHLERVKEDCTQCHKNLPEPGKAPVAMTMETCTKCHEHQEMYQDGRCDVCHKDLTSERLKPPAGFTHQGNFAVQHRVAARSANESCMVCHTQTQCVQCHNATVPIRPELMHPTDVTRNFIHRNDFISRHTLEAQADPAQCYRCHGNNFCSDCHKMQNLTPTSSSPRSPHPRNFVQRGGAEFHGAEAQRDVQRCAACHDQGPQTNCINCHKVGGVGGNPHPSNWGADHNRQDIRLNGMCQYCHQ
jgi:hypothetical protein